MKPSPERAEQEAEVQRVLASYTRGEVSAGKAAEMMRMARMDFERLLGERQIIRPFTMEDLEHDLAWARSEIERS